MTIDLFRDVVPAPGAAVDERALRAFVEDAAAMAATPQDPRWHAEGDVWTHTVMVVEALAAAPAWRALDELGRGVTFLAALLHDVGKPGTTRHEPDGTISSRGHSARGERDVRRALWERDVPFGVREHVCALIRHHQVPFFGLARSEAEAVRTATRLSLRLRHDWLALVAEADARGRRTADPAAQREILDQTALWVEHCRELGCLDGPYPFPSDHTRIVHLERGRPPDQLAFDDTTCEVTVMSGLPASGKDAWLADRHPALPVVSLDDLREAHDVDGADDQGTVIRAAREAARVHLRARRDFAWNATNLSERVRGAVIGLCRDYGARVRVVYCEAPAAELRERNRARAAPVPAAAIARMLDHWTIPALDEAHRVAYVTGATGPLLWPPAATASARRG